MDKLLSNTSRFSKISHAIFEKVINTVIISFGSKFENVTLKETKTLYIPNSNRRVVQILTSGKVQKNRMNIT